MKKRTGSVALPFFGTTRCPPLIFSDAGSLLWCLRFDEKNKARIKKHGSALFYWTLRSTEEKKAEPFFTGRFARRCKNRKRRVLKKREPLFLVPALPCKSLRKKIELCRRLRKVIFFFKKKNKGAMDTFKTDQFYKNRWCLSLTPIK